MSVEYTDFFDNTMSSTCCGASEIAFDFWSDCREHATFDRQCENFENCGNWIEEDAFLDEECQACEDEWNRKNPHPLDIAEREYQEDSHLESMWEDRYDYGE
jgi:hypothetical protein